MDAVACRPFTPRLCSELYGSCKWCLSLLVRLYGGFCGAQVSEALPAPVVLVLSSACWEGKVSTRYFFSIRCLIASNWMSLGFMARGLDWQVHHLLGSGRFSLHLWWV